MKRSADKNRGSSSRSRFLRLRVPKTAFLFAVMAFATFTVGGGLYDLLEKPYSVLPGPTGGWIAVHPLMHEQTLNESLLSMSFYAFIFSGFLLSYRSSQIRYNPRQSRMLLTVGLAILILGVIGSNYLLYLKGQLS